MTTQEPGVRDTVIRLLWQKQFEKSPWHDKFHLIRPDSLGADYGALADEIIAAVKSDIEACFELKDRRSPALSPPEPTEGQPESRAVQQVRQLLARNGRNAANNNEGIRVGSHLHLCEMLLGELDAARAKLDALSLQDHGWQDISTAPRDGENILLSDPECGVVIGYWLESSSTWILVGGRFAIDPTHWQPRPTAPAMVAVAEEQTEAKS